VYQFPYPWTIDQQPGVLAQIGLSSQTRIATSRQLVSYWCVCLTT
jgi:hypothetical protein